MKNSNLKTAVNYLVLVLLLLLLALMGCGTENEQHTKPIRKSSEKETGINGINIITVDSHEYIVLWSDHMIHNENCPNKYHIYNKPE